MTDAALDLDDDAWQSLLEEVDAAGTDLTVEFWRLMPVLEHIHTAAQSARCSPPALLGAVLARTAAITPPTITVPAFRGAPVALTLYTAIIAPTGGGKSSTNRVAARLLGPTPPMVEGPVPLGSGEGFVELYLEAVKEADEETGRRTRTVRRQARYGAMFDLDEGRVLAELAGRAGATIVPVLCSAWTGGHLGAMNASRTTVRSLDAGQYSAGLVALFQPSRADVLFDDTDGGLPGRFLFVSAVDTTAGDIAPEWPGPLDYRPPAAPKVRGRYRATPLEYPAEVAALVDAEALDQLRGTSTVQPLDAHRTLLRLKVAGLLAMLDAPNIDIGLPPVTAVHWRAATWLVDYSAGIRDQLLAERRRKAAAELARTVDRTKHIENAVADDRERRALANAVRTIGRRAHRDPNVTELTLRDLTTCIAGRDRKLLDVTDAVDAAAAAGYIEPAGPDLYKPGKTRPA